MKNLTQSIISFIEQHILVSPGSSVVIGLSGGPDSIFLLHQLATLQASWDLTLIAAHLDHGWRKNSGSDLAFCRETAVQLGITFTSGTLKEYAGTMKLNGSHEEFARRVRRRFLESVAQKHGATTIALAHHADDQEENFFIRLIRGASLSGLTGMKPRNGLYIRPLLHTRKQEILNFLQNNEISYCDDPSNNSTDFLRNRIRHHVLPALHNCDTRFATNFAATLNRLQKTEYFLETVTQETFSHISNETKINTHKLLQTPSDLRYRLLRHWLVAANVPFTPSQALFDEIVRFLEHPRGGIHQLHTHWSIMKKKGWAQIVSSTPTNAVPYE